LYSKFREGEEEEEVGTPMANGKIILGLRLTFSSLILGVLGHLIYARKSLSLPISWRKKVGRLVRNLGRRKDTDTYHVRWFWWNFCERVSVCNFRRTFLLSLIYLYLVEIL
jgi:hypothetical protein